MREDENLSLVSATDNDSAYQEIGTLATPPSTLVTTGSGSMFDYGNIFQIQHAFLTLYAFFFQLFTSLFAN
ncbi:unnamed protein product [Protopolystoma xenopodis]|uniref:Uncharacterized protein n=1 Tax=Protopolystoma xenopodis TaxID=117903 RepID=A0A448WVT7_9PLAT|nr:unnamed protein product [Protopolystoma xenopodis]